MFCDVLSLHADNGDGFYDDVYDDGVGAGDEYGGFLWEGLVCVCKICVGEITYSSKRMVSGAVVESVISVSISESFTVGGIGEDWYGTWLARGLCFPWVDDGRLYCGVLVN